MISASSSSCAWTTNITFAGVSLFPSNGIGNRYITVTVAANTGSAREGSISIAGQPYTISQNQAVLTYYLDSDHDGYGDPGQPFMATSQPSGFVTNSNDCIDYDSTIHPGSVEICGDGIDQDCNGSDCLRMLTQTQVSQLYVSIFGRASEGEGNDYWRSEQDDIIIAANSMLATGAAQAYFGTTLNDSQAFIEFIYKNTLGKTYTEDPAGVNYWVGELAAGKSKGQVVANLINAAIDPQYAGLPAQDQFLNKVAISNYTADTIKTVPDVNDLSAFVDFISGVTDDAATVVAAKAAVDAF